MEQKNVINLNKKILLYQLFNDIDSWFKNEHGFIKNDVHLNSIAMRFGTNRTYVSEAVRMYSKMGYNEYLNTVRIAYAISLFEENPRMTVSEMAFKAGYNLASTFCSAFKRIRLITPGQYMHEYREKRFAHLT